MTSLSKEVQVAAIKFQKNVSLQLNNTIMAKVDAYLQPSLFSDLKVGHFANW